MSSARTWMIGAGGLLVLLAIAGAGARLLQPHALAGLAGVPAPALYVTAGSVALIGVLLVGFAPPSRRAERRVRLDPQEAVQHAVLRPSSQGGVPRTAGMGRTVEPAVAANPPPPPRAPAAAEGAPPAPAAPRATPPPAAPPRPKGVHPNDAGAHALPSAPAEPPTDAVHDARAHARRAELAERLELLDLKANNAKVRFGLGKISAAGYRQYLKEVDQERTLIEAELMESDAD